jgi:hypothetical protein
VEDLATIVEVRIAELTNQTSHEQPRHSTPNVGHGGH